MPRTAQNTQAETPDEALLAFVRALAKRAALADHRAEVARIQALTQARATPDQA